MFKFANCQFTRQYNLVHWFLTMPPGQNQQWLCEKSSIFAGNPQSPVTVAGSLVDAGSVQLTCFRESGFPTAINFGVEDSGVKFVIFVSKLDKTWQGSRSENSPREPDFSPAFVQRVSWKQNFWEKPTDLESLEHGTFIHLQLPGDSRHLFFQLPWFKYV
jgi:hypothetical protein